MATRKDFGYRASVLYSFKIRVNVVHAGNFAARKQIWAISYLDKIGC